jgi:hypothetical protein
MRGPEEMLPQIDISKPCKVKCLSPREQWCGIGSVLELFVVIGATSRDTWFPPNLPMKGQLMT